MTGIAALTADEPWTGTPRHFLRRLWPPFRFQKDSHEWPLDTEMVVPGEDAGEDVLYVENSAPMRYPLRRRYRQIDRRHAPGLAIALVPSERV